jgi:thiamine-phosphate pyrophosphorylase
VVTDDATLARAGWVDAALAVLEAGRGRLALHLRGPATSGRRMHALAGCLAEAAEAARALLVVNDRVDVALACGVPAVHLGARSLAIADVRRLVGSGKAVGVSCHTAAEVGRAVEDGADWIFAGTIFSTPSHPGVPGVGLGGLARMIGASGSSPTVAIGGIVPGRVAEVRQAGAGGVAVLRGIWDAPDPARAVDEYIEVLAESGAAAIRGPDRS